MTIQLNEKSSTGLLDEGEKRKVGHILNLHLCLPAYPSSSDPLLRWLADTTNFLYFVYGFTIFPVITWIILSLKLLQPHLENGAQEDNKN